VTRRDVSDLSDGHQPGEFRSSYPISAWIQIVPELMYLFVLLAFTSIVLFEVGYAVAGQPCSNCSLAIFTFRFAMQRTLLIWSSIALAGVTGGTTFGLKWLYHSVAKGAWRRDRVLWRITVPVISGVLAVFLASMIVSGLVPFFNRKTFDNFYIALGYGFFVGYFSDNALAALKRFANRTFGTVDRGPTTAESTPQPPTDE
jgi:hypothetical protein